MKSPLCIKAERKRPRGLVPADGSPMHTGRRRVGFTLVEVLVTLVILSTGIVMLLRAMQSSITGLERARDTLFSSLLCREKLVDLDVDIRGGRRPPATQNGTFEGIYSSFRWSIEASREESVKPDSENKTGGDGPPPAALYKVTLEVWRDGRDDKQIAVTYLRY